MEEWLATQKRSNTSPERTRSNNKPTVTKKETKSKEP